MKTLRGYVSPDSAFRLRLAADPQLFAWLAGFVRTAFSSTRGAKRRAMVELGLRSAELRRALETEVGLEYGPTRSGLLTVYASGRDFDAACADISALRAFGTDLEAVDLEQCRAIEPAVAWDRVKPAGAIYCRSDETADCRLFTLELERAASRAGVVFEYGARVEGVAAGGSGLARVNTSGGFEEADAVVVAAGLGSVALARSLGMRLPIYPVKGYSITIDAPPGPKPRVAVADEKHKVFVSPLGDSLRAAGVADIVGDDLTLDAVRIGVIKRAVAQFYPGADLDGDVAPWAGLRAMTHDGPPLLFRADRGRVWFNTGHGSLGWTFACAAASITCGMVMDNHATPTEPLFGLSQR
jgi:D-amino-acid dehydrogenase